MSERRVVHVPRGVVWYLVGLVCVLTVLVGCTAQQQATETTQQETESQAQSSQEGAGEAQTAVAQEEQEAANALAKGLLDKAKVVEPAITQKLQSFEDDTTKLVSLEHRLKTEESLTRKILTNAHTEEISLEEAAADIGDVVRYTMCIDSPVYVSRATEVLKALEDMGCTVRKFKNLWAGDMYKGLNTSIETSDGIVFELQFHTPESYDVKEQTHGYYEIARAEDATEEEVAEANRMRRQLNEGLEIPPGALEFTWK